MADLVVVLKKQRQLVLIVLSHSHHYRSRADPPQHVRQVDKWQRIRCKEREMADREVVLKK
jgi:hypothetical protein